jgi:monoamine oxidase
MASSAFDLQSLDPAGLVEAKPLFSHVTTASGDMKVVYVAGQVGMDENGKVADTYEGQVRQTVKNIGTCLAAAGATVKDIVKVNYYIVNYDPDNRPHVPIVLDFYNGHRPATMLVPVPCLAKPEFLFEMDATAVIPRNRASVPRTPPNVVDTTVDVVVVGGGLSGLQAGVDCQKAGLSTLVLEARDRVGGKTWSVPGAKGRGMIELGGAWINDTNQSHMYALARQLKLDVIQQRTTGDCVMEDLDGSISRFVYGEVPAVSTTIRGSRGMVTY